MEPDWRESLRTRRTFNGRLRIHTKADTYRHYEIRVVPIERGGKLAEWIGACTDATSQQEAEAQQIRLTDQLSAAAQRTARLQQATSMLAEALDLEQVVEVITEVGRTSRRLGIAAPTIGRHFTHAGELKMPVVQRAFAGFARARGAASGDGDDPAARLLARCRAYTAFALANPGPYRYVFSQHPPTGGPARPRVVGMPVFHAQAESISRCQQPD